jgi:hypothetical protein
MDDKRTLLAFLLVGLIFLLMPYYYDWMGLTPPPPEERPVQEAVTQERTPDPPTETTPRSQSTATLDRFEAEVPPAVSATDDAMPIAVPGPDGASKPARTVVIGTCSGWFYRRGVGLSSMPSCWSIDVRTAVLST